MHEAGLLYGLVGSFLSFATDCRRDTTFAAADLLEASHFDHLRRATNGLRASQRNAGDLNPAAHFAAQTLALNFRPRRPIAICCRRTVDRLLDQRNSAHPEITPARDAQPWMRISLSGRQAESCELLAHLMPLAAHRRYRLPVGRRSAPWE